MLGPNVIIPFDGNHADIPSGFSRATELDGRFPKGWGNESPNTTGGSDSHSHTSPAHTHSINNHVHYMETNSAWQEDGEYEDGSHPDNSHGAADHHFHNGNFSNYASPTGNLSDSITYQANTNNSLPPYYEVIFIKSTGYNFIPVNGMVLKNETTREGLSYHSASANRFLRGAGASQDAGSTGGTLRHSHDVSHGHSAVSHKHYAETVYNDNNAHLDLATAPGNADANHAHRFNTINATLNANNYSGSYTATSDIQPAYKTLNHFVNDSVNNVLPEPGDIAMFSGDVSDIPVGWKLCDGTNGTPDMRNRFLKANPSAGASTTGGSNTHSHSSSNSHTHTATGSHNHQDLSQNISTKNPSDITAGTGVGDQHLARPGHNHSITQMNSNTATWASSTISANSADSQPSYLTVAYIQMEFSLGGGALQAIL